MNTLYKFAPWLLAAACAPALAQVDRLKAGAIEAERFDERYSVQSSTPDGLSFVPDPAGSGRTVMRATIVKGDAKVVNGLRTEVVPKNEYVKQGPRWYAMSFYVPQGWKEDPQPIVAAQLHTSQKDVILSPPVAVTIRGNRVDLELRANHRPLHGPDAATKQNSANQTILISHLEKAKWYCFVARVDWSSDVGAGAFSLWFNGERIYQAENLYNSYETPLGNYPKVGLYAPGGLTVPSQQIYMDYIFVGGPRVGPDEMFSHTPCGQNGERLKR